MLPAHLGLGGGQYDLLGWVLISVFGLWVVVGGFGLGFWALGVCSND